MSKEYSRWKKWMESENLTFYRHAEQVGWKSWHLRKAWKRRVLVLSQHCEATQTFSAACGVTVQHPLDVKACRFIEPSHNKCKNVKWNNFTATAAVPFSRFKWCSSITSYSQPYASWHEVNIENVVSELEAVVIGEYQSIWKIFAKLFIIRAKREQQKRRRKLNMNFIVGAPASHL